VLHTLREAFSTRLGTTYRGGWSTRDDVWGAPLWARMVLVTFAVCLFAFRFQDRDLVSYVLDEPQLQEAAQADAVAGRWARISVVHGTQGKRYGPAPLWFYTAVHRLVGPLPERSVLATTLLLTVAQLGLALAVARALGGGAVLFSVLAALLASSPYLFFWSRTGWDNPLLSAFVDASVAVFLWQRLPALLRGALLGVLVGLGLSTHLMALPFTFAVLLVVGLESFRHRAALRVLAAFVAAALVVNLPYLAALRTEPSGTSPAWKTWGGPLPALGRVVARVLEPARVLTATGIDSAFLESAAANFRRDLGLWRWVLDAGPALSCILGVFAAAGLVAAARSGSCRARSLGALGLLLWAGSVLFLGVPNLSPEPHYQQATSWLVPTGCCALMMALLPRRFWAAWGLVAVVWGVSLAQVGFTEAWMRWIREHGGTAGNHYSVPLSAQRALLNEACSTDRPGVALANRTLLFPQSLLSLSHTEPACAGKSIAICPNNCPVLSAQWRVVSVRYAAPPAGQLATLAGR
jgi:hypothetical protein